MSFVRDKDSNTRGVGAIAAVDKVSSRGRLAARAQARAMARRDRLLSDLARNQPLSGDVAFSNVLTRMQPVTWHPPGPRRDPNPVVGRRGIIATRIPGRTTTGHPPGPKPLPNGQWPTYRRMSAGYEMLGAAPVNPMAGRGRRPVLDRGGVIEGEGKGSPLGPRTGQTIIPPGGGGGGTGVPPLKVVTSQVPIVLDSKTSPLRPGKKPIRPTHRTPPGPTTAPPVVLLPVPNVTLPYPGAPNTGGGGGGGSSDASPLPEPEPDELVTLPVEQPAPSMSTGKKLAIAGGVLGVLFLLYENLK